MHQTWMKKMQTLLSGESDILDIIVYKSFQWIFTPIPPITLIPNFYCIHTDRIKPALFKPV